MPRWMRAAGKTLPPICRDQRGAVAGLTAMSLMAIIGLGAVSVEISRDLALRQSLNTAATAAAGTGAVEAGQGGAVADAKSVFALVCPTGTLGGTVATPTVSINSSTYTATITASATYSGLFGSLLTALMPATATVVAQYSGGVVTVLSSQ